MFVGDLILMPTSRKGEYLADKFAYECGFGREIISALCQLESLVMEDKKRFRELLRSTHPPLSHRIERLEGYSYQDRINN